MTNPTDLAFIAARGLLTAALATGIGAGLARGLTRRGGGFLLLPWLTPLALPAYAWSNFVPGLQAPGAAVELAWLALMVARLAPLAALVCWLCAGATDAEAMHGQRLLRGARSRWSAARAEFAAWWAGPGLGARAAFALCALLALDEFELASFLPVHAWTVPLFDAQAGGLPLADTLVRALPAMLVKGPLWLLLASALAWRGFVPGGPAEVRPAPRWVWPWCALALLVILLAPLARVAGGAAAAAGGALAEKALWGETARGWIMALAAAGIAQALARTRAAGPLALLALLLGPLPLGLLLLRAFQLPGLRLLYDTPLALALGWAWLLLPAAVLFRAAEQRLRDPAAWHAAALLPSSRALHLRLRLPFALGGLLALAALAAPELTLSSLLACPGWTTAATRLYNFMHYGHSARLSALIVLHLLPALLAMLPLLSWLRRRQ